ncbi:shikimate kinase [Novispirillum sp. DQ9]|uniref:shikimate kinase n=1 Tax=Novispirillum sp. DQ9 TaxID=3398612 RepID=UPI003C7EB759
MAHDGGKTFSTVPAPLDRTVVLVGLMGAGKSVIGRRLSHLLAVPFVDADAEIEAAANCTINEIFARFGEAAFREGEARVMGRLLDGPPCILAAGGGAFMNAETRERIRDRGVSVWLKADLDLLARRTAGRGHRPLLNDRNPRQVLAELIERRYPVYAEADITVEMMEEAPEASARRVLDALRDHFGRPLEEINP